MATCGLGTKRSAFEAFSQVRPRLLTWLWKPFIPFARLVLLEGDPGEGKSLILADMAARVTRGDRRLRISS